MVCSNLGFPLGQMGKLPYGVSGEQVLFSDRDLPGVLFPFPQVWNNSGITGGQTANFILKDCFADIARGQRPRSIVALVNSYLGGWTALQCTRVPSAPYRACF